MFDRALECWNLVESKPFRLESSSRFNPAGSVQDITEVKNSVKNFNSCTVVQLYTFYLL